MDASFSPKKSSSATSSPAKAGHVNRVKHRKETSLSPKKRTGRRRSPTGAMEYDIFQNDKESDEITANIPINNYEMSDNEALGEEFDEGEYDEEYEDDRVDLLVTRKKVRVEVDMHRLDSPNAG